MEDKKYNKICKDIEKLESGIDNLIERVLDLGSWEEYEDRGDLFDYCEEKKEYFKAKTVIAKYDIKHMKGRIVEEYKKAFPGFRAEVLKRKMADEVNDISGVNEELKG